MGQTGAGGPAGSYGLNDHPPAVSIRATDPLAMAAIIRTVVPTLPRNGPVLLFIENSTINYVVRSLSAYPIGSRAAKLSIFSFL